jgi:hypothetical protein
MGLGYFINLPLMSLVGALLLCGIGLIMLNVDVEINLGENTNITYNGTVPVSLESSYNYVAYDFGTLGQTSYGMILLLLGAGLFVIFTFKLGD